MWSSFLLSRRCWWPSSAVRTRSLPASHTGCSSWSAMCAGQWSRWLSPQLGIPEWRMWLDSRRCSSRPGWAWPWWSWCWWRVHVLWQTVVLKRRWREKIPLTVWDLSFAKSSHLNFCSHEVHQINKSKPAQRNINRSYLFLTSMKTKSYHIIKFQWQSTENVPVPTLIHFTRAVIREKLIYIYQNT